MFQAADGKQQKAKAAETQEQQQQSGRYNYCSG